MSFGAAMVFGKGGGGGSRLGSEAWAARLFPVGADSGVAACGAGRTVAPSSRAGHAGGEPCRRAYL